MSRRRGPPSLGQAGRPRAVLPFLAPRRRCVSFSRFEGEPSTRKDGTTRFVTLLASLRWPGSELQPLPGTPCVTRSVPRTRRQSPWPQSPRALNCGHRGAGSRPHTARGPRPIPEAAGLSRGLPGLKLRQWLTEAGHSPKAGPAAGSPRRRRGRQRPVL